MPWPSCGAWRRCRSWRCASIRRRPDAVRRCRSGALRGRCFPSCSLTAVMSAAAWGAGRCTDLAVLRPDGRNRRRGGRLLCRCGRAAPGGVPRNRGRGAQKAERLVVSCACGAFGPEPESSLLIRLVVEYAGAQPAAACSVRIGRADLLFAACGGRTVFVRGVRGGRRLRKRTRGDERRRHPAGFVAVCVMRTHRGSIVPRSTYSAFITSDSSSFSPG